MADAKYSLGKAVWERRRRKRGGESFAQHGAVAC